MLIKARSYFSDILLMGGATAARKVHALECSAVGSVNEATIFEHHSAVVTSIMMSAGSLEASINELFSDASEPDGGRFKALSTDSRGLLAAMWNKGVPRTARYSIIEKYELCLTLLRKPDLDKSQAPYDNAQSLIELRNHFVHFEPEWQLQGRHLPQKDAHRLEKVLRGKFPDSPLAGAGNSFYPERLLGHGCAAWAVTSADKFLSHFFALLQMPPPHDLYRQYLSTASI
jgi:hypothetical protein